MRIRENPTYIAQLRKIRGLDFLSGKTILIAGAGGMLGSCLADAILLWNQEQERRCRVIAMGRNESRLREWFGEALEDPDFLAAEHDVCRTLSELREPVDYVIHAASNADPANMAKYPVETLLANVLGTENLMEYGIAHGMKRFLYISSGEAYGQPDEELHDFVEDYCGPVDLKNPRTCYPEGKRAAEALCQSYRSQYGADLAIVRPCHLFGPTMSKRDSRAAAEFLWRGSRGQDIVLKSAGTTERSHCYVVDAVNALLAVLERGENGEAYNIADRRYQMTVRAFAEEAARAGGSRVLFQEAGSQEKKGYLKIGRQVLNSAKLENLGWSPLEITADAIGDTVRIMREADDI